MERTGTMQKDTSSDNQSLETTQKGWLRRNWKWGVLLILAAIVVSRFTFHVGYVDEDKREAVEMIGQFHQRMNAGRFDDIYDELDPAFKKALSREDFLKHMQETSEQYGQFRAVKASKLNVIMGAPVQTRAGCYSIFEKGEATEFFSYSREGHHLQLLIYGIYPGSSRFYGSGNPPGN